MISTFSKQSQKNCKYWKWPPGLLFIIEKHKYHFFSGISSNTLIQRIFLYTVHNSHYKPFTMLFKYGKLSETLKSQVKSPHRSQQQTSYTSRPKFLSPYLQFRSLTWTQPALILMGWGGIGFMVLLATPLGTEVRITLQKLCLPLKAKAVEKYTHKLICKMG